MNCNNCGDSLNFIYCIRAVRKGEKRAELYLFLLMSNIACFIIKELLFLIMV